MFSIIIPLYNKCNSIRKTLNSVLSQKYSNFEIIIVNDGSTDNSVEIVSLFVDERIKLISIKNSGVSNARNIGIKNAKYKYIAFLDADDIWLPNHLLTMFDLINKYHDDSIAAYSTKYTKSKNDSIEIQCNQDLNQLENVCLIFNYMEESYYKKGIISSSNFVAVRDKLFEIGLYNVNLSYGEDVDLWYRLFRENTLVFIDRITCIYFTGAENRSNSVLIPLEKRFHKFNFENVSFVERKYLSKLVALIILDYFMLKSYKIVFQILKMYRKQFYYIISYYCYLLKFKFCGK